MKFAKVAAVMMMASLSSPLFAASEQSVGTLSAASQGTMIARDGKLIQGHAGQSLFVGDRVITRGSSKASVALQGCNVALAKTSILAVDKGCAASKSFAASAAQEGAEGAAAASGSSTGYVVGALAVLAVAGGVVAATSNSSTRSVSP